MLETVSPISPTGMVEGAEPIITSEPGVLVTDSGLFAVSTTEADAIATILLLIEQAAAQTLPSNLPQMSTLNTFSFLSREHLQLMHDIQHMHAELNTSAETPELIVPKTEAPELPLTRPQVARNEPSTSHREPIVQGRRETYNSLFSLARAVHKESQAHRESSRPTSQKEAPTAAFVPTPRREEPEIWKGNRRDPERESGQQGKEQEKEKEDKKFFKNPRAIRSAKKSSGPQASAQTPSDEVPSARESLGGVENIFIRFMALMARMLGQAEAEAHQLYVKIKERTDNVDTLTLFISKLNSTKEGVDWTKDVEMQKLVERARAIGVDIPAGKYKWSEDEKILLKENIQMRKDSMEKITQLERTDMQRFLQEASQCHQARSNVLKLLKEVIDTIIYNMRP